MAILLLAKTGPAGKHQGNTPAAGDVCAFAAATHGQIQRLETWRNAELQDRHVASSMLETAKP